MLRSCKVRERAVRRDHVTLSTGLALNVGTSRSVKACSVEIDSWQRVGSVRHPA